ncbi:metal ABC transporter substrate-binding protein [soil metagenome]
MQVVVGFYPLEFLVQRIGGDLVEVSTLAQPGAHAHDLELAPQQVQEVAEADLVLFMSDFQPAVDDAVAQNAADTSLDVASVTELAEGYEELDDEPSAHDDEHSDDDHSDDEVEHSDDEGDDHSDDGSDLDPHVWLDPTKCAELAAAIGERMAELDADNGDTYTDNAEALGEELRALDEEYQTTLAECARTEIVTTHNAFGYLAARYDLEQVGIAGLSPDAEPSPQRLDEIREFAEDNGITTIFYEETVSPEYAETIAEEVGASTQVLTPIETAGDGEDYMSLMRSNLATLQEALDCT